MTLDCVLDELNLLANGAQLVLLKSVELVEAPPGPALDEPDEDAPHALEVNTLVAWEAEERSLVWDHTLREPQYIEFRKSRTSLFSSIRPKAMVKKNTHVVISNPAQPYS